MTKAAALHQRIRSDIEGRILSGAWAAGERIPFEHELMAQYGCARMTVSKALSALAEAGLIERRRRAGTFVARPRVHSAVLDIPDIGSEIVARGEAYDFRLLQLRRRPARPDRPEEVDLAGDGELLAIHGLHLANGRPFALERRLISLAAAPAAAEVDFATIPPGAWLLSHVPWTEAENRILAENASAETARRLGLAAGAACLVVERRTWRGADHITHVRQTFPGEAYDLIARFGPSRP